MFFSVSMSLDGIIAPESLENWAADDDADGDGADPVSALDIDI